MSASRGIDLQIRHLKYGMAHDIGLYDNVQNV